MCVCTKLFELVGTQQNFCWLFHCKSPAFLPPSVNSPNTQVPWTCPRACAFCLFVRQNSFCPLFRVMFCSWMQFWTMLRSVWENIALLCHKQRNTQNILTNGKWNDKKENDYYCFRGAEAIAPAISLCTTPEDMIRWIKFNLFGNENIVDEATWEEIHQGQQHAKDMFPNRIRQPLTPVSYVFESYGLGWFVGTYRGMKSVFLVHYHLGYVSLTRQVAFLCLNSEVFFVWSGFGNVSLTSKVRLLLGIPPSNSVPIAKTDKGCLGMFLTTYIFFWGFLNKSQKMSFVEWALHQTGKYYQTWNIEMATCVHSVVLSFLRNQNCFNKTQKFEIFYRSISFLDHQNRLGTFSNCRIAGPDALRFIPGHLQSDHAGSRVAVRHVHIHQWRSPGLPLDHKLSHSHVCYWSRSEWKALDYIRRSLCVSSRFNGHHEFWPFRHWYKSQSPALFTQLHRSLLSSHLWQSDFFIAQQQPVAATNCWYSVQGFCAACPIQRLIYHRSCWQRLVSRTQDGDILWGSERYCTNKQGWNSFPGAFRSPGVWTPSCRHQPWGLAPERDGRVSQLEHWNQAVHCVEQITHNHPHFPFLSQFFQFSPFNVEIFL